MAPDAARYVAALGRVTLVAMMTNKKRKEMGVEMVEMVVEMVVVIIESLLSQKM